jgi:pyruvate dehydrogenase E2 component (dihydrolipoamide acetyltransferase)
LVELGKQGKLTPDEMQGGTFTVSNLGMYPIGGFTPVINLPEAAILGIGGISEQAVVENGAIRIGKVTEVSLTFDHRITDGAPAAMFLTRIKALIEQPYLLFMEY